MFSTKSKYILLAGRIVPIYGRAYSALSLQPLNQQRLRFEYVAFRPVPQFVGVLGYAAENFEAHHICQQEKRKFIFPSKLI